MEMVIFINTINRKLFADKKRLKAEKFNDTIIGSISKPLEKQLY
jgi:hypothetical protein